MAKKKDIAILIHPNGNEFEFEADHAARIMARADAGGWKYKEEPKTTKADAGKRRSTKAAATEAQAPEDDCGCN